METGAAVLIAGIATILAIHALREPEHAQRYATFLLTGQGPGGRRIVEQGALDLGELDALPGFGAVVPQATPAAPSKPPVRQLRA